MREESETEFGRIEMEVNTHAGRTTLEIGTENYPECEQRAVLTPAQVDKLITKLTRLRREMQGKRHCRECGAEIEEE